MDDKRDLKDASIKERIAALTNFLPFFEAERFSPGQWKGGEQNEEGVSSLPWYEFIAEVS